MQTPPAITLTSKSTNTHTEREKDQRRESFLSALSGIQACSSLNAAGHLPYGSVRRLCTGTVPVSPAVVAASRIRMQQGLIHALLIQTTHRCTSSGRFTALMQLQPSLKLAHNNTADDSERVRPCSTMAASASHTSSFLAAGSPPFPSSSATRQQPGTLSQIQRHSQRQSLQTAADMVPATTKMKRLKHHHAVCAVRVPPPLPLPDASQSNI